MGNVSAQQNQRELDFVIEDLCGDPNIRDDIKKHVEKGFEKIN